MICVFVHTVYKGVSLSPHFGVLFLLQCFQFLPFPLSSQGCVSSGKCPHGWKKFGCSCYSLSQERSTWQSSRQQCGGQGADLVIINSWREMLFLNRLGSHLKFWIGLSQSSSQTQWMWVDGIHHIAQGNYRIWHKTKKQIFLVHTL
uniref:C-type lectin domain-containing protein n=1 Tax=Anabas testudineus TaxID=64144 RepID=A0A3Q1H462_ANATE